MVPSKFRLKLVKEGGGQKKGEGGKGGGSNCPVMRGRVGALKEWGETKISL